MKSYPFTYRWRFSSKVTPSEMWPFLSNTDRFFKDIGQLPIQTASISHEKKKGYKELSYEHLHRNELWEEAPFQWEAPYHLSVRRTYKYGYYKTLLFSVDLARQKSGTSITIQFSGYCKGWSGWLFQKKQFNSYLRRKIGKVISTYSDAINEKTVPLKAKSILPFRGQVRWSSVQENLGDVSGNREVSNLLIDFIETADNVDLLTIKPTYLARLWGKPIHEVIDVLLFAAKLNILNFSWDMACPSCRKAISNSRKLSEITDPLYCKDCDIDVDLDFTHTVQLVFHIHPLLQKLVKKTYCAGSPQFQPHIVMQQQLQPGQKKFAKIGLDSGTYKIHSDSNENYITATVSEDGLNNATLTFQQNEPCNQSVILAKEPNLILHNQTDQVITIICEETDWEKHSVSASYITSLQLFRNLFPQEIIRPGRKIIAKDLTILFTDLYNSSEIYSSGGDELAIRQVMDHFDILNQAILDERGAVVKTIGDAVMAVFPNPIHAVQAFNKAKQQLKKHSNKSYPIQLKGGIHSGDCTAVTLNSTVDYFGNTVNIASRLVEHAQGNELVISNDAYNCPMLHDYILEKRGNISIHQFDVPLKGFENQPFEAKKITVNHSPLRLVV